MTAGNRGLRLNISNTIAKIILLLSLLNYSFACLNELNFKFVLPERIFMF